jgi:hypothetical protein
MRSEEEGPYTRTDVCIAIVLAVLTVAWIIAYVVAFVQSGPA